MTTTQPSSNAQLSSYTGDPQQVFLSAIDAKVNGHLTDEQFDAVVSSIQTIPTQTAYTHPIPAPIDVNDTRQAGPLDWLPNWHPLFQTVLLLIVLAISGALVWVAIVVGAAGLAWVKANAVGVAAAIFVTSLVVVLFKVMAYRQREQNIRDRESRRQQVMHVYEDGMR